MSQVLVVEDDPHFAPALVELVEQRELSARAVSTLEEARRALRFAPPQLLLIDLILPDGSGLELLQDLDASADTQIVIMTAHPTVDAAIDSLRARVLDFIVKPIDVTQLHRCLDRAQQLFQAQRTLEGDEALPGFEQLVGDDPAMQEVYGLIKKVAPSDVSVLIQGESGTGKELVAQAIHARSLRAKEPFLSVNCGAVPHELIGSELFGHEKGSFTGAARQHRGFFERAHGGTLFLDEITEMPLDLQVQLLRVLETHRVMRIGGDREIDVNVRIVAATNRDPMAAVEEGQFREDLFFRLAVFPIRLPALRERRHDIPLLANHFLAHLNRFHDRQKRFAPEALHSLAQRPWHGNVRELKNAIQRAFILADDEVIGPHHLPDLANTRPAANVGGLDINVGMPIEEVERQLICATLEHYGGDKPRTASALGISLKTLYNRLKQYDTQKQSKTH
ncbi:MAG: sigma-54-dependent transcriptional regulator [Candidatus Competibacterales bacterium]